MTDQGTRSLTAERKRLHEERERTLVKLEGLRRYLGSGVGPAPDRSADSVDAAADIYEREKTLGIIRTLEEKLLSIERALRATGKGSYGICEVCGEPIAPGRLEVMPHTTTCVRCQAKRESLQLRGPSTTFRRDED